MNLRYAVLWVTEQELTIACPVLEGCLRLLIWEVAEHGPIGMLGKYARDLAVRRFICPSTGRQWRFIGAGPLVQMTGYGCKSFVLRVLSGRFKGPWLHVALLTHRGLIAFEIRLLAGGKTPRLEVQFRKNLTLRCGGHREIVMNGLIRRNICLLTILTKVGRFEIIVMGFLKPDTE